MSKLYGWYSAKEAAHWAKSDDYPSFDTGIPKLVPVVYTTPGGDEVVVTEVTPKPRLEIDNFGDFTFLGEVVKYVRSLK